MTPEAPREGALRRLEGILARVETLLGKREAPPPDPAIFQVHRAFRWERAGEGFCAHSTAKSGLDAFVKSLALELGPSGVRVNVVAPGLTLTDATSWLSQKEKDASALMTPLRRNGLPEDVAGAVLFLASDEARFITGAYLPVSGGIQMP